MSTALSETARPLPDGRRPPPPRLTALTVATLVALASVTLALAWSWRWTADDAFINFRVVRNILDGSGPVFNAGERVEVATSPLWLWLLTLGDAVLPADIGWIAVVMGGLLSTAAVVLACLGATVLNRPRPGTAREYSSAPLFLPAGVLVFLALPATWPFLTSGLETGLTFAWLGAVWWGTARQAVAAAPGRPAWLLVLLGVGPLVRPDLALVTGVVGLWLLLAVPSSLGRRLRDGLVIAAAPVAYEVFRMGYYGLLVPNTAVAKESSRQLWARGWAYLGDLLLPYGLPVVLVICLVLLAVTGRAAGWDRRVRGLVAVTVLSGVLQALFVVRVGGDFMHGRLLLPALFQILCPIAMVPVARRAGWNRLVSSLLVATVAAWAALCATSLRVDYLGRIGADGFSDERGVYATVAGVPHPVTLQDYAASGVLASGRQVEAADRNGNPSLFSAGLGTNTDPPRLIPLGDSGDRTYFALYQAGYQGLAVGSDIWVIDYYGLTDPVGAHLEAGEPERPGHEKLMPVTWFWARYGEGLPDQRRLPDRSQGIITPGGLAAARAALGCGELAELVAATNEPMRWARFWDNLVGAPERTALRIPVNPREAETLFC